MFHKTNKQKGFVRVVYDVLVVKTFHTGNIVKLEEAASIKMFYIKKQDK